MTTQKIIDNIQTRLENLISERFTGTYQNIDITCSNYNPSIDSNITITITVTDQNDDPVTGFTVPLKIDGTSISGITTNSNGIATHTYTCNAWGNHKISVKSVSAFIKVSGWKRVHTTSFLQIDANEDTVECRFNSAPTNVSFPTSFTAFEGQVVPSGYRPSNAIVTTNYSDSNTLIAVNGAGEVKRRSMTGSSLTGPCVGIAVWRR